MLGTGWWGASLMTAAVVPAPLPYVSFFTSTSWLQIAEATVLHNEVQLQETLEGRLRAEEQVCSAGGS